jgi:hypothetical protein
MRLIVEYVKMIAPSSWSKALADGIVIAKTTKQKNNTEQKHTSQNLCLTTETDSPFKAFDWSVD